MLSGCISLDYLDLYILDLTNITFNLKSHNMKDMIKTLAEYAKNDPKDFTMSLVLLVGIFGTLVIALTVNSIINY